jgi:hypothetical protein
LIAASYYVLAHLALKHDVDTVGFATVFFSVNFSFALPELFL